MTGRADLIRVLSSVWELPYAGVKPMDGLAVWRSTAEGSTMSVLEGADQLLIIPLTGEVTLATQGSSETPEPVRLGERATLLRQNAEGAKLRLKGESTMLVLY